VYVVLRAIFNYHIGNLYGVFEITFFQNIILFFLVANDLLNDPKLKKKIFLALISGVFIMGSLSSLGIGIEVNLEAVGIGNRLSFFGSNPNNVGNLAAVTILFVIAMVYEKANYFGKRTLLLLLTLPSLLSILALSGSRGALVISFAGAMALIFLKKTTTDKKIIYTVFSIAILAFALNQVLQTGIMENRIQKTLEEGNIGGRGDIWNIALGIFYENPFFGVGNTGYDFLMAARYGEIKDTHNIFLYFMVSGGIIALGIYLIFFYSLYKSAKRYYRHFKNPLLFALLLVYLVSVFKSGGAINSKLYWILAAVIFGLGNQNRIFSKNNSTIL
jgi:O-antigen ligase